MDGEWLVVNPVVRAILGDKAVPCLYLTSICSLIFNRLGLFLLGLGLIRTG